MRRGRAGFTIAEVVVALAVVTVLAAALVPSLLGSIDRARVDQGAKSLQALVDGIGAFRDEVLEWPSGLGQLSAPITATSLNACGLLYNSARVAAWSGPYIDRVAPATGLPIGIGIARDQLTRDPITAITDSLAVLMIVVDSVAREDAVELNARMDADGDSVSGTVRWTSGGIPGIVTVQYARPVRGC